MIIAIITIAIIIIATRPIATTWRCTRYAGKVEVHQARRHNLGRPVQPCRAQSANASGRGQMGSALMGSLQILYFLIGTFRVLPLTCFYLPQSAYFFPQSVKNHYFAAAPLALTPFVRRNQRIRTRQAMDNPADKANSSAFRSQFP